KTKSDKKVRICKCCGSEYSIPQKLREHLKRKNLCKPLQEANQQPIEENIQKPVQKELGLGGCLKTENLDDCITLCYDLEQYDPEVVRPPTKEELKEEIKKRQERPEKDLEFREQEELRMAVKRSAIAIHHAKVSKSHPDNRSDIRK
ncbi:14581_t:CDS:2, partial [Racocetra persica]